MPHLPVLIVDPFVQVTHGISDRSPDTHMWDPARCGHAPQRARTNRQGLGSLLGGK